MFSDYLETTSIHGLRYLGRGQRLLSRLAWSACVAASFAAAVVIIYYNVVNWENSPSVITQAQPMLVEELEVPMPTVTVCPRNLDLNSLLVAYFDRHYNHTEKAAVDAELNLIMTRNTIERVASENKYALSTEWKAAMEKCTEDNSTIGDPCHLVLTIGDIYSYLPWYITDEFEQKELVIDLVVDSLLKKRPVTLETIAGKLKVLTGLDLGLRSSMHGENYIWWQGVLHFYSVFHSVKNITDYVGKNRGSFSDIIGLDEVNEIVASAEFSLPSTEGHGHMGSLFGHLMNVGMRINPNKPRTESDSGMTKLIMDAFVGYLVRSLGVESIQNRDEVIEFLSYYSYDPEKFFARRKDAGAGEIIKGCNATWNPCAMTNRWPKACQDYCQLVKEGKKAEGLTRELFEMGSGKVNRMQKNEPRSMLPDCTWSKDNECWAKVVTDRGMCFTDYFQVGKLSRHGRKNGLDFMFDKNLYPVSLDHSNMSRWESYFEGVDVVLTSRGDFALGRLDSEVDSVIEVTGNFQNVYDLKIAFTNAVRTTPEFRDMDPLKRNCLYPDETRLDFFPVYSEANCRLECAWKHAAETCHCVPWFLMDHFPSQSMCEVFGNQCFKTMVDKRFEEPVKQCQKDCPHDCEITEFNVEPVPTYYNLKTLCQNGKKDMEAERKSICGYADAKFNHGDDTVDAFLVAKKFYWDEVDLSTKYFRVYVHRRTVMRVLVTATVSAIDMISNIGGTLGLFSGFSILSGIELLYWAAKIFKKKGRGNKKKSDMKRAP